MRIFNIVACIGLSCAAIAALAQPNVPIPFRASNQTDDPVAISCSGANRSTGLHVIGASGYQSLFYQLEGDQIAASRWTCEVSANPTGQISGTCSFTIRDNADEVCLNITKSTRGAGCSRVNC